MAAMPSSIVYTSPNNINVSVSGVRVALKPKTNNGSGAASRANVKIGAEPVPFMDVFPQGLYYTTLLDSNGVLSFVKGEPPMGPTSAQGISYAASDCYWADDVQVLVSRSIGGTMRTTRPVALAIPVSLMVIRAPTASMGSLLMAAFMHVVNRGTATGVTAASMFESYDDYSASVDYLQAALTTEIARAMNMQNNYDLVLQTLIENGLVPLQTSGTFQLVPSSSSYYGTVTLLDMQFEMDVTIGYGTQATETARNEIRFEKLNIAVSLSF